MCETNSRRTGRGETPEAAVRDLIPSTDREDVAWVEGVRAFPDRTPQSDETKRIRRDLTVIYESKPVEQWLIHTILDETEWCAYLVGTKRID